MMLTKLSVAILVDVKFEHKGVHYVIQWPEPNRLRPLEVVRPFTFTTIRHRALTDWRIIQMI